jgi:hypothetical protein
MKDKVLTTPKDFPDHVVRLYESDLEELEEGNEEARMPRISNRIRMEQ